MTCIAIIKNKRGKLVMAGDRRVIDNHNEYYQLPHPKIMKRDGLLMGAAGIGHLCDIIMDTPHLPFYDRGTDQRDYVFNKYVPRVLAHLRKQKLAPIEERKIHGEKEDLATILLGIGGKAFSVQFSNNDISVEQVPLPFSIGSGGPYVLAVLKTLDCLEGAKQWKAKEQLQLAFKIVSSINVTCDDKVDIIYE